MKDFILSPFVLTEYGSIERNNDDGLRECACLRNCNSEQVLVIEGAVMGDDMGVSFDPLGKKNLLLLRFGILEDDIAARGVDKFAFPNDGAEGDGSINPHDPYGVDRMKWHNFLHRNCNRNSELKYDIDHY